MTDLTQIDPVLIFVLGYLLVPAIQALKQTRADAYVSGSGWVLVALALGFAGHLAWALAFQGWPATEGAWRVLLTESGATATIAGAYYDYKYNDAQLFYFWRERLGAERLQQIDRAADAEERLAGRVQRDVERYGREVGAGEADGRKAR